MNDTASTTRTKISRRRHDSLLARPEKRLLQWIARRLPGAVTPDHLTLLGLLAMAGAGAAYALQRVDASFLHLVNFCLLLNWLGDSLDGTLARVRGKLRPRYGFYVDHVLDSVGALFLMTGLALSGLTSPALAAVVLVCYLMISIDSYLAAHALGEFRLSYFRLGPTELRLLLVAGNLVAIQRPWTRVLGEPHRLFDLGGAVAAAVMALVLVVSIARNTLTLYRQERV